MKKLVLIFLLSISNAYAVELNIPNGAFPITAEEASGQPNYTEAMRRGFEAAQSATDTAYAPANAAANLRALELQNKLLEMQLASYLAAHPEIAREEARRKRDLDEQEEAQNIVNRNTGLRGLFKKRQIYINELTECANNRNKYCAMILKNELTKSEHRVKR